MLALALIRLKPIFFIVNQVVVRHPKNLILTLQLNCMRTKHFFFFLLLITTVQLTAQRTLIHCGKLIDTKDGKVVSNVTIIVQGSTIADVVNGFTVAAATDKVIDLKNKTVMPGLMDMHVHLESETK